MNTREQALIVGLGNPGKRYEMTRHNIGFLVIKEFAKENRLSLKNSARFNAKVAKGSVRNCSVHLIMPGTYMNQSGCSVRRYMDYFHLSVNDVIVVVDDMALPFGQIRVREKGGAGGHNGLKSIENHLGNANYLRLRIGISGQHVKKQITSDSYADYVLGAFSSIEQAQLPEVLTKSVDVLKKLLTSETKIVMNEVNKKVKEIIKDESTRTEPL